MSATGRSRKRNTAHDDASYFAPHSLTGPGIGTVKRHAGDRVEGERAPKRKRMEPAFDKKEEERSSLIDFSKFDLPTLYKYLETFDLLPAVYPSPLSASDPSPPPVLKYSNLLRHTSPPPPQHASLVTPANRPRRDLREKEREAEARRSLRLLEEDELLRGRPPIRNDVNELKSVLASIAENHFKGDKDWDKSEVETLAEFIRGLPSARF
ncbi:hypothetical protein FISHEDRAFT_60845 [Fistulina hepatica ATCC 64428]|uniref:Uncharacterized protein n=1 Tax=Fistulina hepatica ATCC 64428 TaxID=1128425 RepID=A0A0D7A4F3_9AGAR|nr:hypothetical protein FISHEDRAFT_60845 [Fistulina hepatica ATCC 64428]